MFRRLTLMLAVFVALSFSLCNLWAHADSMMFRGGPQRTGSSEFPGPTVPNLEVKWSYQAESWICSTPAMDGESDLLVFGANDNKVHACNLNGEPLWTFETGDCVYSSPLLAGGKVYVGSLDGNLYALSYSGELEWVYETGGAVFSSPVGYVLDGSGQMVAFGSDDGKVYSLTGDGALLWSYQTQDWVSSSPAVSEQGELYAGSYDGNLYAFNPSGTLKWSFEAGGRIHSTPAVGPDGGIVFGTMSGTLFKVLPDGSEAWRFEADGTIFGSPSIDPFGNIRFGTMRSSFYLIRSSGELVGTYEDTSEYPCYYSASPLVDVAGRSYLGTIDRSLLCIRDSVTRLQWKADLEGGTGKLLPERGSGAYGSVLLDADGQLYVPCMNGYLYCLGRPSRAVSFDSQRAENQIVGDMALAECPDDVASLHRSLLPRSLGCSALNRDPLAPTTMLDEALKLAGHSYESLPIVTWPVYRDVYRLNLVEYVLEQAPDQGPAVLRELADAIEFEAVSLTDKIIEAGAMADIVVESPSFSHIFGEAPLAEAIRAVYKRHGAFLTATQEEYLNTVGSSIDSSIQQALGLLILAMDEATRLRDEALDDLEDIEREKVFRDIMNPNFISNLSPLFSNFEIYQRIDKGKILHGGAVIASVIDSLLGFSSSALAKCAEKASKSGGHSALADDVLFTFETPIGSIILGGAGDNTYRIMPDVSKETWPALLVDLGGNDTYKHYLPHDMRDDIAASVVIDVAGDDLYDSDGDNAQGAGCLGAGFCIDMGGDDVYVAGHFSQGAGWGGVGILYDSFGADQYYGDTCCQGAGFMGVGLLIDENGDDVYSVDEHGQAFGYIRGAGVLLDTRGDDLYFAGGEYEHMYEPPRTTSMSQGYGFGVRLSQIGDPHASGGVGLLIDSAGDDTFVSDFFGTAGAYWLGLGMLMNRSGNDTYMARQYSIASGIHLAVGLLVDDDGDDTYLCRSLSQGCAHDNSVGILVDNAGDDIYLAQDFSQSATSPRSFSALVDNGGNDMYWAMAGHLNQGESRYQSEGGRKSSLSILLDAGGNDWYQIKGEDNMRWTQLYYGVCIDSPFGNSGLH